MKKIAFILIISFVSTISFAQLKVVDTGKVGINIGANTPVSNLSINSVGDSNASLFVEGNRKTIWAECTGIDSPVSSWIFSVVGVTPVKDIRYSAGLIGQSFATSSTGGRAYGVMGVAGNSTTGYNYGVFGTTYGTQDGAGVIGTTNYNLNVPISGIYAGYFHGDV